MPSGVMVKELDSGIVVSEIETQWPYCVHFRTKTFGKGMNPRLLGLVGRVFSNGPGDLGSIPISSYQRL